MVNVINESDRNPSLRGKPVLIVTATKVESQAVLDIFSRAKGKSWARTPNRNLTYYDLGIHGGVPIQLVQSEIGTATRGGALLTVYQAIQDVAPQAIIMCGVAFGMDPQNQKLGELLIAKQIEYYEPQKIDKRKGKLQRGERVGVSERLLDRFRSADIDWKGVKTHFGLVISGEKLVNDPVILAQLQRISPEAIGGEMEAAGLYTAASEAKIDWIVVKAICDWGDGHKNSEYQEQAAKNAAQFVLHVLQQGGMGEFSVISNRQDMVYQVSQNENFIHQEKSKDKIASSLEHQSLLNTLQRDSGSSDENSAEQYWLQKIGLKENPFRHWDAEERDPYLPDYFSRSIELQQVTTSQLMRERKTWFFGGDEGYGKTALRRFLAAKGRPIVRDADLICFEVDQREFERLITQVDEIPNFDGLFFRAMVEKCLSVFPGDNLASPMTWQSQAKVMENITILSAWLRERGVDWVLCLVDPSKETFSWKRSPVPTALLLEPLISFPESGGVGLRFFLPTSVKDELKKKFPPAAKNERRYMQIEWDEAYLVKLIAKRMTALSKDQSAPLRSIGQVCDNELAPLVDQEIASLAQGSPRAAIWLANRLVEVHCQEISRPPAVITKAEWEMVKTAWWDGGEGLILGASKPNKFIVLEKRIFYRKHEIILGGRSHQLLGYLASAKDGFRSNDEIIRACWLGENPSGITQKALSEAMRRMKNELIIQLKKYGVDVNGSKWVKNVRKRGYQLEYPDLVGKDKEGG